MLRIATVAPSASLRLAAAAAVTSSCGLSLAPAMGFARRFCTNTSATSSTASTSAACSAAPSSSSSSSSLQYSAKYKATLQQLAALQRELGGSCTKSRAELDAAWTAARGNADAYTLTLFYPKFDVNHTNHSHRVRALCAKHKVSEDSCEIHCTCCGRPAEQHHRSASDIRNLRAEVARLEGELVTERQALERGAKVGKVWTGFKDFTYNVGFGSCFVMGLMFNSMIVACFAMVALEAASDYLWPEERKKKQAKVDAAVATYKQKQQDAENAKLQVKKRRTRRLIIGILFVSAFLLLVLYKFALPLFFASLVPVSFVL